MSKIHIITLASLLVIPIAFFQDSMGYPMVAEATLLAAYFLTLAENNKYTSNFQAAALLVITGSLAFIVEAQTGSRFLSALSLLFSLVGNIGRMVFIKQFSYARFRYFELLLALVSAFIIAFLSYFLSISIISLIPVIIIWASALGNAFLVLWNANQLDKERPDQYFASIGSEAPDFALVDHQGALVSLSDYYQKQHVLLIFVRGNWCPYCHMILRTYMRNKHKFQEKNILLMAIGPDPVGINKEMAENLGLEYKVLSDDKMLIAQQYGIRLPEFSHPAATKHEEGMPLPASFLVDKKGYVRYTSRASKVGEFLDPNLIFPIVESLN